MREDIHFHDHVLYERAHRLLPTSFVSEKWLQKPLTGMIPLIFAQSILLFPALLSQYLIGDQIKWLFGAFLSGVPGTSHSRSSLMAETRALRTVEILPAVEYST